MWNGKMEVISVVTGAAGTIAKSFRKYFSNKLGKF
jgi:hypothetical protein